MLFTGKEAPKYQDIVKICCIVYMMHTKQCKGDGVES